MPDGTVVVLLNRDLRVHDHPALAEACREAEVVVPLFVFDPALGLRKAASANRPAFLLEALADLDQSLRERGGRLHVRRGEVVAETMNVVAESGASAVYVSADVSRYARHRQQALRRACGATGVQFRTFPGVTVVAAGDLLPAGGDHFKVFTPYWNRWREAPRRPILAAPRKVPSPEHLAAGRLPSLSALSERAVSPARSAGGETPARGQVRAWLRDHLGGYDEGHDDLPGDRTSRLSPYLHFGCLSPNELADWAGDDDQAQPFVRQLCWRDFHHQVLAAFPDLPRRDYRPRGRRWNDDEAVLDAWTAGQTGIPVVDAGMRQLLAEGWMHNRARLLTAAYLTREVGVDWRRGAEHFMGWLVDADVADNAGNWQWVAGTGNDTRPNRRFNLTRQAKRFDPDGDYVRRYVPELSWVAGGSVHEPWGADALGFGGYPRGQSS